MEIWKDIRGYEGIYEISNLGNVKSLNYNRSGKEGLLKVVLDDKGYLKVCLCLNGKGKTKRIHQLLAEAFLNHIPCGYKLVVDHKNQVRNDCRLENLQIITQRKNADLKHIPSSSQYVGVYWNKQNKKWMARIVINGKAKYLGYFINEYDAHLAYQTKLNSLYL